MYENLFKPGKKRAHRKEVGLYQSFLGNCHLIFDVGAYDGHKTAAFLEIADKVLAVEPDPDNFKLLNIRFRNKKDRVFLKQLALSDKTGNDHLMIHQRGSAFNTLNPEWKNILEADSGKRWNQKITFISGKPVEVKTETLDTLIDQYGKPDFIKIDVEGFEKRVFMGLSQKVPCISFECLLPEFRDDLLYIIEKLLSFDSKTKFNAIHEEELVFPEFVNESHIREWIAGTKIFSFDIVARSDFNPLY
jgi:FkbM family methyltransferase